MSDSFDPYHVWLGIPPESRPPTHYELLGISPKERERAVIEAAMLRQSGYVRNFQIGKYAKEAARVLNEIAAAKACVVDKAKRAKYDAELMARQPAKATAYPAIAATIAAHTVPLAESVDLDLLSAAAVRMAPLPPANAAARRRPALLLKAPKRNRSQLAWQLPTGISIGLAIALAAFALWPRHSDNPLRSAGEESPVFRGAAPTEVVSAAPVPPPPPEKTEPAAPPPLAIAPRKPVSTKSVGRNTSAAKSRKLTRSA